MLWIVFGASFVLLFFVGKLCVRAARFDAKMKRYLRRPK
jgi:hypothetical protein